MSGYTMRVLLMTLLALTTVACGKVEPTAYTGNYACNADGAVLTIEVKTYGDAQARRLVTAEAERKCGIGKYVIGMVTWK
jgi:hypothetical protein